MLKGVAMEIESFRLERWLNSVTSCEIDVAQGVVMPLKLKDITTDIDYEQVMTYGVTNGSELLRKEIADWFPGVEADNILVTSGTSEANLLVNLHLLEPGDEYVALYPLYQQTIQTVDKMELSKNGIFEKSKLLEELFVRYGFHRKSSSTR